MIKPGRSHIFKWTSYLNSIQMAAVIREKLFLNQMTQGPKQQIQSLFSRRKHQTHLFALQTNINHSVSSSTGNLMFSALIYGLVLAQHSKAANNHTGAK